MRKGSNIPSHSLPTCRDVPFSALYLASYEMLKQEIPSKIDASPNTCHFLAGLGMHLSYIHNETVKNRGETTRTGAGIMASLVTHPADVVKTRMQVGL